MSNPAPTLNQINAFNATQGTTIDFNIIGGTEVIRSNKIYIYDLSDNSLICTHLYVSTESIHELPPNTSSSIVYASGKSSADFTNNTQYYAQIQTFTDVGGTQGGSGLSIAKLFWCLPTPTLTLSTIPTTISTTSYNVSATYTPNTSGGATNEIQEFQFNLYSAIGALLQTSGVVLYGEGVDLSYNFSGLEVDSTYYVTLDVTTTQGMNVSAQSNTFTVSIDTPTMGSASVVNNGCDGYISVTSNLSSEYEHEESAEAGEIMSFTTDSVNDIIELDVDFNPVQDDTPWMSAQDTTPYMFRPVPTQTEDFGHESDCIVGGTVGANQYIPNYPATTTINGVTFTNNGDSITVNGTATGGDAVLDLTFGWPINGVYFLHGCPSGGSTSTYYLGNLSWFDVGDGYFIKDTTAPSGHGFRIYVKDGVTVSNKVFVPQATNITQMFGSTIADYVYSIRTNNEGAMWLRANAPQLFEYHAYDAGSLVSVSGLTSHDMVGFNQWDEEWEVGAYSSANGSKVSDSNRIRCKNQIPVIAGATYYFKSSSSLSIYGYDIDGVFVVQLSTIQNTTQRIPNNVHNITFNAGPNSGETYANDICINLSDVSLNGTYKPYTKHSYPLDSTLTLRGIPKLDASNNLYYDGDVYHANGNVDRRYGIVDLGTLTWELNNANQFFASDLPNASYNGCVNMLCPKYIASASGAYTGGIDKSITINGASGKRVWVIDTAYSTANAFKTAMSGVYLVYELATPTTESADPYTNPQVVDPSGTEEYVGSPIPVGHKTTYQRICPITGWTGCEVSKAGVNLFDASTPVTYGQYLSDGTYSDNLARMMTDYVEIKPNTDYTAQVDVDRSAMLVFINYNYFDANKNWLGNRTTNGDTSLVGLRTKTFNISDARAKYIRLVVTSDPDGSILTGRTFVGADMQIEIGTTATPYQPYQGTTYTSTFPKYKQQVTQDKTPYITKNIGDTYADTLTENLVGGTIAWNQSVPDTTTTHTISGSIASMNDAVAGNFESVVCDINPVQDLHGYDKPWVGGSGKNKLNIVGTDINNGYIAGKYLNYLGSPATPGSGTWFVTEYTPITGGATITISGLSGASTPSICFYDSSKSFISGTAYEGNSQRTITVPANSAYFRASVGPDTAHVNTMQVELGSTATTYEPYSNICPITGWTGCEVDVAGVNIWDEVWESGAINSSTGANQSNANAIRSKNYIPVVEGQTYYIKSASYSLIFLAYDSNNNFITGAFGGYNTASRQNATLTIPSGVSYLRFNASATTYNNDISINYPSTDTTYHAHNPNSATYPVSWQTEAGTVYGGTVDLVTGVLTDKRLTKQLTSAETITLAQSGAETTSFKISSFVPVAIKQNNAQISSHFTFNVDADVVNPAKPSTFVVGNSRNAWFQVPNSIATTVDAFKTWIDSQTIIVSVELATPTTYQLDPVQVACLLGRNNVWNNISNTTVTYPTNHSYQSLSTTHKYYKRINGVESISVGSDVVANVGTDNIIDLTQMFGTTIANYIYNREQSSSSGMGVKFFKSLFPNNDYDYNSGELISVNASAHVIKDANGNVLHTYPLDSDLVLRGIPKLDANNKLYYDGDVYEPDGTVTRKYGIVDLGTLTWVYDGDEIFRVSIFDEAKFKGFGICSKYQVIQVASWSQIGDKQMSVTNSQANPILRIHDSTAGTDATAFKSAMSGIYLVYELAEKTTEQADPFEENQAIVSNGIAEYTVTEQGDVEMPVGHDSTYYTTAIYGGTIDMAKGVLTITHKSMTLDGTENGWQAYANGDGYAVPLSDMKSLNYGDGYASWLPVLKNINSLGCNFGHSNKYLYINHVNGIGTITDLTSWKAYLGNNNLQIVYELETPIKMLLTPQQMQTLSGQNNIWSNTNGGMYLVYQLPITSLLVKRRDVADVSGKWLTLYSTPITQASDMDFTFIDFLNQYGKTYQYALVPVLAQDQSGVVVQIEGGYTVSDNVDSIFDGVYIADQTNVERVKAGVGYGNIDMNQGVGSITPIGSKYPIVITNSQNQYHNGSIRGTIVPNDFYSNGNLSRMDMVNKRDELEQFLTNKRAKIIKDWNGKMWLVMIMSNVSCSFDDNYGMGMVSFSADWLEVGDPTNQQDLYNAGLINVGGV